MSCGRAEVSGWRRWAKGATHGLNVEDAAGEAQGIQRVVSHQRLFALAVLRQGPGCLGRARLPGRRLHQALHRLPAHLWEHRALSALLPLRHMAPTHHRRQGACKKPPLGEGRGAQRLHDLAAEVVEGGEGQPAHQILQRQCGGPGT